jgi:hypothetical protein
LTFWSNPPGNRNTPPKIYKHLLTSLLYNNNDAGCKEAVEARRGKGWQEVNLLTVLRLAIVDLAIVGPTLA